MPDYLNLGCGRRRHPAFTNVDFDSDDPAVMVCDLRKGIPFPDNHFGAVYHSHVLEHFSKSDAPKFLSECFRVMKPGGVLRVVVPDLERIVRDYLENLAKARKGDAEAQFRYEWTMLEMLDQIVREKSGGEMAEFIRKAGPREREFLLAHCGEESRRILEEAGLKSGASFTGLLISKLTDLYRRRGLTGTLRRLRESAGNWVARFNLNSQRARHLELGRFRAGGEVHLWMYDSHSLGILLSESGFSEIQAVSAMQSRIAGWTDFHLDTQPDGSVYKPDSLFMEGIKPSADQMPR